MRIILVLLLTCHCLLAQQYQFGRITKFAATGGGASPAYGGFVQSVTFNTASTSDTLTLTAGVPLNGRVVITMMVSATAVVLTGVADSRGNSYTVHLTTSGFNGDQMSLAIASANCATALQVGDTITFTWGSAASVTKAGLIDYLTGVTGVDVTEQNQGAANNAPTASKATTAAPNIQFGHLWINDGSTYSSSAWTVTPQSPRQPTLAEMYTFYHVKSVTGTENPAGSLSANDDWFIEWVNFK